MQIPPSYFTAYEAALHWVTTFAPDGQDKFVHVQAGLALWLGSALLSRRPLTAWLPLLVVLGAEGANEVMDRFAHGSWAWHDTLRDMACTWFWPVVLFAALRACPSLLRKA